MTKLGKYLLKINKSLFCFLTSPVKVLAYGSVQQFVAFLVSQYFGKVNPAAPRVEVPVNCFAYLGANTVQVFVALNSANNLD